MIQIAELAYQASMLVWAVAGLVLLPLLAVCGGLVLFHKTRAYGGVALWLFSWLVGLSTWLLGAAFTFGWIGLIVGLLLFGMDTGPDAPAGAGRGRAVDRRRPPLPGVLGTRQAADRLRAGIDA